MILHPNNLKEKIGGFDRGEWQHGLLESSLGNFGEFEYDNLLVGRMHYPKKNRDGCQPFSESDFNEQDLREASLDGHRPIIMVDRGTCHFVLKAKHIQEFGGILAVIVDDKKYQDPHSVVMADDGKGSSIRIPSFLIKYMDGQAIKDHFEKTSIEVED